MYLKNVTWDLANVTWDLGLCWCLGRDNNWETWYLIILSHFTCIIEPLSAQKVDVMRNKYIKSVEVSKNRGEDLGSDYIFFKFRQLLDRNLWIITFFSIDIWHTKPFPGQSNTNCGLKSAVTLLVWQYTSVSNLSGIINFEHQKMITQNYIQLRLYQIYYELESNSSNFSMS